MRLGIRMKKNLESFTSKMFTHKKWKQLIFSYWITPIIQFHVTACVKIGLETA